MRFTCLLFFASLLFFSSFNSVKNPDTDNNPDWFTGKWEGMGDQVDGSKWKVKLNVKSKKKITIEYPDLFCSGKWNVINVLGDVIKLKENIIAGTDKCDQGCDVTVEKITDFEITVNFFLKSYPEGSYARARLKKM